MSAPIEAVDGRIHVVTTYLEMTERPRSKPVRAPLEQIAVLHAERPTVSFYRYLYETVGGPWLWWERRLWTDEALRAEIQSPGVEITVLYVGGVPAGYVELDARAQVKDDDDDDDADADADDADDDERVGANDAPRRPSLPEPHVAAAVVGGSARKGRRPSERPWQGRDVELAYFGLVPDFIGRGLGWYLLHWAVERAWFQGCERLWVHTCNLDHPRALMTYQRAGFVPYRQESSEIDDPRPWLTGSAPMPERRHAPP